MTIFFGVVGYVLGVISGFLITLLVIGTGGRR